MRVPKEKFVACKLRKRVEHSGERFPTEGRLQAEPLPGRRGQRRLRPRRNIPITSSKVASVNQFELAQTTTKVLGPQTKERQRVFTKRSNRRRLAITLSTVCTATTRVLAPARAKPDQQSRNGTTGCEGEINPS